MLLERAVFFAGLGQLALTVGSLAIPQVLQWRAELVLVRPLTRQFFWVYAGYVRATCLGFGLLSLLAPQALLDRSLLATVVCGFIAAYWAARIAIQFLYLDWTDMPPGWIPWLGEVGLMVLSALLAGVYGAAAVVNATRQAAAPLLP